MSTDQEQLRVIASILRQLAWLVWPAVIGLIAGILLLGGVAIPGRVLLIGSWLAGMHALYLQWRLQMDRGLLPWLEKDLDALDRALVSLWGGPMALGARPLADRIDGIRRLIRQMLVSLAVQQGIIIVVMFLYR